MTVQAVEAFSPYVNVAQFGAGPTWLSSMDSQRINAYQVYEQIYWNVPETFKLVMRGEDNQNPIYVPTARTLVDTTNRFLCPKPGFLIDPDMGSPEEQEEARRWFSGLFRRERYWSKFQSNKLYGIMRGDWMWHILANPAKPAGTRIKIEAVDPAAYIPVTHPDDPDNIVAVHLVEQVLDEEDNVFIRRQTYTKGEDPLNNDGSDRTIWNSVSLYDIEDWQDLGSKVIKVVKTPTALPAQITAIPVYHIPHIETPNDPFGSSELRGFERILAAVNQAVSDEELALALEGLGLYETDGGPPRDEAGRITNWQLGPGRVVEHTQGSKFSRVTGISSVTPVQDHLKFLIDSLKEASAVSDAVTGKIDVQVAESGIARLLNMGPMLSKVSVREEIITDIHNQMFWDIRAWLSAYEQFDTPCIPLATFGSAIPEDVDAEVDRILKIIGAGLADAEWGRTQLANYGFIFPEGTGQAVLDEAAARAQAVDPFASRMMAEDDAEQEA
jgi:hypothetical protein